VKVKLVENNMKSHVGRVMEVKVTIQYRIPGITLNVERTSLRRKLNIDRIAGSERGCPGA
jgi:uncharacterized membrane protein